MFNLYKKIHSILIPKSTIMLGRWSLKHDYSKCENYILNYYAEPGYPNKYIR